MKTVEIPKSLHDLRAVFPDLRPSFHDLKVKFPDLSLEFPDLRCRFPDLELEQMDEVDLMDTLGLRLIIRGL